MGIPHEQLMRNHIGQWLVDHGVPQGKEPNDFEAFIDAVGSHVIFAHQDLVLATLLTGVSLQAAEVQLRRLPPGSSR